MKTRILACALLISCSVATMASAAPEPEALAQSKSRLLEGFQAEVTQLSADIDSGQFEGKRLSRLLRERGVKRSHLLRYPEAIEDFSRAIDLDGFNPQFYQDRAIAYLRSRDFAKADTDLAMLLGIDRNNFAGLREKGRTAFYRGQFLEAADYFLQASQNADQEGRLYAMLWMSISAQRAGRPSPLSIQGMSGAGKEQWPVPVAELYTGAITPEQLLARAEPANPRAYLMHRCEQQFYLGEYYMIKGDKERARASFQAAVDTGITDFMEYDWALHELEQMGAKSK